MQLHLYHGRDDANADLEDWGFDGPTLHGVQQLLWTYGHPYIIFIDDTQRDAAAALTGWKEGVHEHSLELQLFGDLVATQLPEGDKFYGDWTLRP